MIPKHISEVPDNRRAVAPYNFVQLPEKVVEAQQPLPHNDHYHSNLFTGRIECTLTTESPLYTRCRWTPEDFAKYGETQFKDLPDQIKNLRANFFINPATQKPIIPGSSIRGMLRTLVEIVSFGKIERVSDEHRLFFRAVAATPDKDSLGEAYKIYVDPKKVKAGYLKKDSEGWYIQPAKTEQGATFAWVRETSLNLPDFKKFNDPKYEPQYISVSYRSVAKDHTDRAKRLFANDVELPDTHPKKGVLVTSGNMKQGNEPSPRRNHCVVFECLVFEANSTSHKLRVDHTAIEHYRNALTDFQKKSPFNKDWGVLEEQEDRPVFYYHEQNSNTVGFFGQSPNFRIPYSPQGNGHATTVVDFIPEDLRKIGLIDLADAIFGWVKRETKDEKLPTGMDKQRAGRVFITDAMYHSDKDGIWYEDNPIIPQILASPKPTTFQHYLVQPKETNADRKNLKHYASEPFNETVLRGHKLYWHKGSNPEFKLPPTSTPKKVIDHQKKVLDTQTPQVSDTQTTLIKPIKKGVNFKFDIHFENLSDLELGALMWVINIAQNDNYRLKLGMGKPLGLGAVKIEPTLYLSNRHKRYQNLFDSNEFWETGETESNKDISNYVSKFETYILEQLNHTGDFKNLCRIQMLLAMLSWPGLDVQLTRYMEIERDINKPHIGQPIKPTDKTLNEYKERPVLPNPLDVMGIKIECDRPSPSLPKKSAKEPVEQFSEGQEIDAQIVNIEIEEGKKLKTTITYDIQGSDCQAKEEVYKQKLSLTVGEILKVSIVKAQGKSIRKVKRV